MRDEAIREFRASLGNVELRADGDGPPVIVGYAAVFDRVADLGWFEEEVAPGAFTETIRDDDIRALVDHTPARILGRNAAGTLRLSEDKVGLRMEIDVPDNTTGADIVATSCPSCIMQMEDMLRRNGLPQKVVHIAQLLVPYYERTRAPV